MGSGSGAEKIYQLIEELDNAYRGEQLIFENLIKFLPADTLVEFVSDFRKNYDMTEYEEDDAELFENEYHLCMDCQESYDISSKHECSKPYFFSSLIPEC
jgi:hypothetical protein